MILSVELKAFDVGASQLMLDETIEKWLRDLLYMGINSLLVYT